MILNIVVVLNLLLIVINKYFFPNNLYFTIFTGITSFIVTVVAIRLIIKYYKNN